MCLYMFVYGESNLTIKIPRTYYLSELESYVGLDREEKPKPLPSRLREILGGQILEERAVWEEKR